MKSRTIRRLRVIRKGSNCNQVSEATAKNCDVIGDVAQAWNSKHLLQVSVCAVDDVIEECDTNRIGKVGVDSFSVASVPAHSLQQQQQDCKITTLSKTITT